MTLRHRLRYLQWLYPACVALFAACAAPVKQVPAQTLPAMDVACPLPPPDVRGAMFCVCTHSGWLCTAMPRSNKQKTV